MRVLDVEGQPLNAGAPVSSHAPEYNFENGSGASRYVHNSPLASMIASPGGWALSSPPNSCSFRPEKSQPWRPSKAAIIGTTIGLVVVAALVFGLVFGLGSTSSSSSDTGDVSGAGNVPVETAPMTSSCTEQAQGTFFFRPSFSPRPAHQTIPKHNKRVLHTDDALSLHTHTPTLQETLQTTSCPHYTRSTSPFYPNIST